LIFMRDNSELNLYLKHEWKNDHSWLIKGPDCCPDDGLSILAAVRMKYRKIAKALDETYGQIACCL